MPSDFHYQSNSEWHGARQNISWVIKDGHSCRVRASLSNLLHIDALDREIAGNATRVAAMEATSWHWELLLPHQPVSVPFCSTLVAAQFRSSFLRLGGSSHRVASENRGLFSDQVSAGVLCLIGRLDWWASGARQTCVPSAAPSRPQRAKTKRQTNSDRGTVNVKIKQVSYC